MIPRQTQMEHMGRGDQSTGLSRRRGLRVHLEAGNLEEMSRASRTDEDHLGFDKKSFSCDRTTVWSKHCGR